MKRLNDYPARQRTMFWLGAVLVGIGLLGVVARWFTVDVWRVFVGALGVFFNALFPLAVIGLGAYLIWAYFNGGLKSAHGNRTESLHRSATNARIAGVCGGIAEYYGIDPTIVRVCVLLLFLASPPLMLLIYLLLALVIPRG